MSDSTQFTSLADAVAIAPGPLHLAVGMFDGVHLGHRSVIEATVQSARRSVGRAAVLTFWPHPSALFRPEQPTRLIMDSTQRTRALLRLGVDAVVTQPFTPEFARIAAGEFLPWLRAQAPGLAGVYAGENFRFGQGRRGDVALLVAEGRRLGVSVFSAPRVNLDGEPVSSTRIRLALEAGRIGEANAMLGRNYASEGRVEPGRKLGRTLGFPTLNLPWAPDLRPRFGVYAVQVSGPRSAGQGTLPAVANWGVRPTVDSSGLPLLEVHLLVPCPFGEGDALTVDWLQFLRPEAKFENLEALRAQIAADSAAARAFFKI
jgi:riboflavin kinase/FMN adenylyltransferase